MLKGQDKITHIPGLLEYIYDFQKENKNNCVKDLSTIRSLYANKHKKKILIQEEKAISKYKGVFSIGC